MNKSQNYTLFLIKVQMLGATEIAIAKLKSVTAKLFKEVSVRDLSPDHKGLYPVFPRTKAIWDLKTNKLVSFRDFISTNKI